MRRFIVLSSWFMVFIFVFLFLPPTNNHLPITILAAESTPSGDFGEKLKQLKEDIASKAAVLKKEITQRLENKAFVGVVKTKSDSSITLATKTGTKIVSINQDTQYQDRNKKAKTFSLKILKEEDRIAALGEVDDTGVLIARKVVLLPTTNSKQHALPSGVKTILWGQILSVSDKLITIRDKDSKTISLKEGKNQSFKELETNDYVIATGYFNEEVETKKVGTLETVFIYVTASSSAK